MIFLETKNHPTQQNQTFAKVGMKGIWGSFIRFT